MYGIWSNDTLIAKFAAPMTVKSNSPIYQTDTLNLRRKTVTRSAQRWEIETSLEPLSAGAEDLFVEVVTKGFSGTITVLMPQNYGVIQKMTTSSEIRVSSTISAGASSIPITNNNGILPKGTFIAFSNHSKVYMTTSELSTSAGSVGIYPPLVSSVDASLAPIIKYKNSGSNKLLMNCLFDSTNVRGMSYTDGILQDLGTITLIEKL